MFPSALRLGPWLLSRGKICFVVLRKFSFVDFIPTFEEDLQVYPLIDANCASIPQPRWQAL